MSSSLALRYIEAVERENERSARYHELLLAAMATPADPARVAAAQTAVDILDGDGDY